jgi:transglutaminase-like putative cysteine protease
MRLRIRHETAHRYARAPGVLAQLVRLTPPSGAGQRVVVWRVADERGGEPLAFRDGYGNACHLFTRPPREAESRIVASGEVETGSALGAAPPEPMPPRYFLRATPLTAHTPELRALAAEARSSASGDPRGELLALAALVCARVAHAPAHTHVATRASDALAGGAGVCQDRAQVFVAAARALAHPARYVSGYWHGAADDDLGAMHAWGEAWLADAGWLALDPSTGEPATQAHVRVAIGLDYSEAAPIRGVQRGGGDERLAVRVRIDARREQGAQQQ